MRRIARFEKVSYAEFEKAWMDTFPDIVFYLEDCTALSIKAIYDAISLPLRATSGSAGYDFFAPATFHIEPGKNIKIPTGIRAWMEEDYVLQIYPRSSLGFKYRLQADNTVGIIDSDYYHSDNEGHIFVKLTNHSIKNETVTLPMGAGFIQGLFIQYGITIDDDVSTIRNGGIGSTTKK